MLIETIPGGAVHSNLTWKVLTSCPEVLDATQSTYRLMFTGLQSTRYQIMNLLRL